MPLTFEPPEPLRLELTVSGDGFALLIGEIPSTSLFELAQAFQRGQESSPAGGKAFIPKGFARLALDAVVEAATGWEGVEDAAGEPLPFDRATLRSILESDVAVIPPLINIIADRFVQASREERRLEEEKKN